MLKLNDTKICHVLKYYPLHDMPWFYQRYIDDEGKMVPNSTNKAEQVQLWRADLHRMCPEFQTKNGPYAPLHFRPIGKGLQNFFHSLPLHDVSTLYGGKDPLIAETERGIISRCGGKVLQAMVMAHTQNLWVASLKLFIGHGELQVSCERQKNIYRVTDDGRLQLINIISGVNIKDLVNPKDFSSKTHNGSIVEVLELDYTTGRFAIKEITIHCKFLENYIYETFFYGNFCKKIKLIADKWEKTAGRFTWDRQKKAKDIRAALARLEERQVDMIKWIVSLLDQGCSIYEIYTQLLFAHISGQPSIMSIISNSKVRSEHFEPWMLTLSGAPGAPQQPKPNLPHPGDCMKQDPCRDDGSNPYLSWSRGMVRADYQMQLARRLPSTPKVVVLLDCDETAILGSDSGPQPNRALIQLLAKYRNNIGDIVLFTAYAASAAVSAITNARLDPEYRNFYAGVPRKQAMEMIAAASTPSSWGWSNPKPQVKIKAVITGYEPADNVDCKKPLGCFYSEDIYPIESLHPQDVRHFTEMSKALQKKEQGLDQILAQQLTMVGTTITDVSADRSSSAGQKANMFQYVCKCCKQHNVDTNKIKFIFIDDMPHYVSEVQRMGNFLDVNVSAIHYDKEKPQACLVTLERELVSPF